MISGIKNFIRNIKKVIRNVRKRKIKLWTEKDSNNIEKKAKTNHWNISIFNRKLLFK